MAAKDQVIDGKYRINELIGQGGMSKVYLARDTRLNKLWAIKEVPKNARDANNEIVVQSAIAEAHMIKQLDNPAIVRIVDIIDEEDVIYIVEDYIEGETLKEILEREGAQPEEKVVEWGKQICAALEYLHTRKPPIIYRDMKPSNVMLKPAPDNTIKIIDFGIAREYKEYNLADTISMGTRGYAPPESFGGKTDARTDIYSLGVTLYHLVTGHCPSEPPYEIYPIRYWNPQLDPGLEAIIEKCTQLNPNDRYQSCAELLYALQHYKENGVAYRAKQKKKLNTFIATAVTSVFFALIGILGLTMRTVTNNADYEENIRKAEIATSVEEKISYYQKAIDIMPTQCDTYMDLIGVLREDRGFSLEEEQILKSYLSANIAALREQEDYGELAFEIGKLYWYYYEYGKTETSDNQVTRMKNAIPWFTDAENSGGETAEYYVMSTVYREIGEFNRDITLNIEEASDSNLYAPYWESISELVAMIVASEDENEMIQLEVYKLAMYSIENYARKFKADGIEQEDVQNLFETVKKALENVEIVDSTSDKIVQLKADVMARIDSTQVAIDNAYRK